MKEQEPNSLTLLLEPTPPLTTASARLLSLLPGENYFGNPVKSPIMTEGGKKKRERKHVLVKD